MISMFHCFVHCMLLVLGNFVPCGRKTSFFFLCSASLFTSFSLGWFLSFSIFVKVLLFFGEVYDFCILVSLFCALNAHRGRNFCSLWSESFFCFFCDCLSSVVCQFLKPSFPVLLFIYLFSFVLIFMGQYLTHWYVMQDTKWFFLVPLLELTILPVELL